MERSILAQTDVRSISVQPIGYHQLCNLNVRSNVMNRQNYNAATDEFVPDYTISALVIFPECRLINPDSPTSSIQANKDLISFSWQEVTSSGSKVIATDNGAVDSDKYGVVTSGENRGQLSVKCNSVSGIRRSLRFVGLWIDETSGYRYRFTRDIPLIVEDVTTARPEIMIDMPNTDKWNPFRQQKNREIHAKVLVGSKDRTEDAKTKIFWYRINNRNSKTLINSAEDEDNWEILSVTKGENGQINAITVDRDKMGDCVSYEVKCAYRGDGVLPDEPEVGDPMVETTLVRCFPKIEAMFTGANARVQGSDESITLKAIVTDSKGVIPNWQDVAYANWYDVTYSTDSEGNTIENRTLLGRGAEITIPTATAKRVKLEICDKGSTAAMVEEVENAYITDNEDQVLTEKIAND